MKKIIACFISLLIFISCLTVSGFAYECALTDITNSKTPLVTGNELFVKKFGNGFKNSPTTPLVVGDSLIVVSGDKLYKLDAENGEIKNSLTLAFQNVYATVMPVCVQSVVYVQLDPGIIQAIDINTMQSLWVYKDSIGGQALCPITYDNGYIYTGFWNGETEYANYVCISVKDENKFLHDESKSAVWTYKALGGFYWAGSCVYDNYLIVGKDDGQYGSESDSEILCLNKNNGKKVSALKVKGDIRSSVNYNEQTKSFYVSGKYGFILKFSLTSSGHFLNEKYYYANGGVTASPVIYNGRMYIGAQKGAVGEFLVIDAESMNKIYSCDMSGYPQGTALVSAGYEDSNGKVYIYLTYNKSPGGITVFEDSVGQTSAVKRELYTPTGNYSQYCISNITVSSDGVLYYKNDSGCIFAIKDNMSPFVNYLMAFIVYLKKMCENIMKFISVNF